MPADPRYRRRLFLWYGIAAAMLLVVGFFGIPFLQAHFRSVPFFTMLWQAEILALGIISASIPAAFYLLRLGAKTLSAERYPFEGMRVIRDTRIVQGPSARRIGITFRIMGIISIGFTILGLIFTHVAFEMIRNFYRNF